ncbi:MAG TPA: signal recognition particle receptor subunit alpha, partial [Candidatus Polarisedimenticolia bacterium]|nr:signal recognition particle receptor subunit alpha [Candidatus Polarisedimenticolia bacterium]
MAIELAILAAIVLVALGLGAVWLSMSRRRRPGRRGRAPGAPRSRPGGTKVADRPSVAAAPAPSQQARATPTTEGLAGRIRTLFRGGQATEEAWRGLEEALVRADVGPKAAVDLVGRVRASYRPPVDPAEVVIQEVSRTFAGDARWSPPTGNPGIVMVVGVNGTGKTTTIGKLAHLLAKDGLSVSLANSDTFRAAA